MLTDPSFLVQSLDIPNPLYQLNGFPILVTSYHKSLMIVSTIYQFHIERSIFLTVTECHFDNMLVSKVPLPFLLQNQIFSIVKINLKSQNQNLSRISLSPSRPSIFYCCCLHSRRPDIPPFFLWPRHNLTSSHNWLSYSKIIMQQGRIETLLIPGN